MRAVDRVVNRFGGQTALASAIGKAQTTVAYWVKSGNIPRKWRKQILEAAVAGGIELGEQDFNEPSTLVLPSQEVPFAQYKGDLDMMGTGLEMSCYVLSTGQRVIGRTSTTEMLTGVKGGGDLEKYLGVNSLKEFIDVAEVIDSMVEFTIPEIEASTGRKVKGLTAESVIEVCQGFVRALQESQHSSKVKLTQRQRDMAIQASMFLSACAKTGLVALIDEATGYQYERAEDALRMKIKLFLEEEMRAWEKTFPDELWKEFGRLTKWQGSINSRPKYWGKLVMELVYTYLDPDVADWLKQNKPKPRSGKNYHQWMSSQYGLKRLTEHIWMVIGMARACKTMHELRQKMAQQFGREEVQISLFLPPTPLFPEANESSRQ
jgi:hypothetical protein